AVNTGLVVALGSKLIPAIEAPIWMGLSSSGMIGAMFGTPVAAALVLSESAPGDPHRPLWDRMFAPLVAAGAGAFTTDLLSGSLSMSVSVPAYPGFEFGDWLKGAAVASVAALLGLAAIYAFPHLHRIFYRIGNPLVMVTAGGALLGVLGVVGG